MNNILDLIMWCCFGFVLYVGYSLLPPQAKMVEHCADKKSYSEFQLKDQEHNKTNLKTKIDSHFLYSTYFEICEKESIENPKFFKIKYAKGTRYNFGNKFELFMYNLKSE